MMYQDEESKLMLEKMYPVTEAPIPSASASAENWTVLKDIAVEPTLYNHLIDPDDIDEGNAISPMKLQA